MRILSAFLAVGALLLVGCGGSGGSASSGTTQESTSTSGGAQASADGKQIFTQNCAGCHTLADAGASGAAGPNLDQLKPDQATVKRQVTNGGGGMPAFKDKLSAQQIDAVAAYVASVAGKS